MIGKNGRPSVRSLRRYIHTQGFTRLSGNRRVESDGRELPARIVLTSLAAVMAGIGLWFVFF